LAEKLFLEACGDAVSTGGSLDLSSLESRCGVRVRTRGRGPLVKQLVSLGTGGVWINTGYYKSGIILSWLMAKDLAAKITQAFIGG
jgi:glycine/D-amino acid oxidase-like deaminating enzyme